MAMPKLDQSWRRCLLGDVLTLHRGYDLPERDRRDGTVPIVSSSGVTGYHDIAKVPGPGVVTGRYGTLGEVFYIGQNYWPLNTTLYVSDFKGNDPLFLSNFLRTLNFEAQNAAGAVPGINRNHLHMLTVCIPPLETQRKIAAILSAYDDLIENNTRRIAILEQMAQALYREWFVAFRFPGHEHVRMVDSPLGPIPEGWEVAALRNMASLAREGVDPSRHADEHFAHYSIPAFDEGQLPFIECGEAIKSNKFLVPADCVLVSKINPRIPRVWLPHPDHTERGIASTEFLVLRANSPYTREYVYSLCRSDAFMEDLAGRAMGTSTSHQRVKSDDFLGLNVVCPSPGVVRRFTDLVSPMLEAVYGLRQRSAKLSRTRDLLLPKLIAGEVDVEGLALPTDGGER